jgi:hypothetical protein
MARETKFGKAAREIRKAIVPESLPYCYERDPAKPWKWVRVHLLRGNERRADLVERLMELAAKVR